MDVLVGFLGLLLGWGLGFGSEVWRGRREARDAARLVLSELQGNLVWLIEMRKKDYYTERVQLRDAAWQAYGIVLLRLADYRTTEQLVNAYAGVDAANRILAISTEFLNLESRVAELREALEAAKAEPELLEGLTSAVPVKSRIVQIVDHALDAIAPAIEPLVEIATLSTLGLIRGRRVRESSPSAGPTKGSTSS